MKSSSTKPALHDLIKTEAARVARDPSSTFNVAECPALAGLMDAAMNAVEDAIPAYIDYQGQRYWLCVRVLADVGIHDKPGTALPIVRAMSPGNWCGHKPGH